MSRAFEIAETPITAGLSVIEASAGTGKTYAISHLVARLLLEGTVKSLGEIVLVTYTNDAARELAARVRRVLEILAAAPATDEATSNNGVHLLRKKFGDTKSRNVASRALLDLDLLGVSTIHSFCQRVLQAEGALCGVPVVPDILADSGDLVREAIHSVWENRIATDPLLSTLATCARWDPDRQAGFLLKALDIPNVRFVPEPRAFGRTLEKIRSTPSGFTDEVCEELRGIFAGVTGWNGGAPDRDTLLDAVARATTAADPAFFSNVLSLADCTSWITKRGSGKEAAERAAASEAVRLAGEFRAVVESSEWDFQAECLAEVRERVGASLHAQRQITYEGLISAVHKALTGPHAGVLAASLRARFQVALIDESQDTDARQFEIFQAIFLGLDEESPLASHRLVLIGDPKQAIYAFRGADVNTYIAAREKAGPLCFSLATTFRSPAPLVRATNALFSRPGSLLMDGLAFEPATSGLKGDFRLALEGVADPTRLECWITPDADAQAYSRTEKRNARISETVASEVVRLLASGATLEKTNAAGKVIESRPVTTADFAVLVSDGTQARAVADAFAARGVPAVRAGADDIMASPEAADLLALLQAMQDPRRSGLRRVALATTLLGRTAAEIRSADGDADAGFLDNLLAWQSVWVREGVSAALSAADRTEGIAKRLAGLERGERRVTNLRQLTDLLESASREVGPEPAHLTRWLSAEIAQAETRASTEERQQQIESDAEAVQIVTMHASKGLQYPLVFCPFLWSEKALSKSAAKLAERGKPTCLVNPATAEPSLKDAVACAQLEDRIRLAYVAVTRAQAKVWIQAGAVAGKKVPASALDWLLRETTPEDPIAWMKLAGCEGRGERHALGFDALVATANAADVARRTTPPEPSSARWVGHNVTDPCVLRALPPPTIPRVWGLTSFSALTREKHPHREPEESGLDFPSAADPVEDSFLSAPGGALVGTAVHEWIERWDFSEPDPSAVDAHFQKYPLADCTPSFSARALAMLRELRQSLLPGLGVSVAAACPEPAASEWHFQLPIRRELDARTLAGIFERHGMADYAARLSQLPSEDLIGYLHGFIDRVVCVQGQWGVVDWKTNRLGSSAADYGADSLLECAASSHYLLQAHLYLVALRRFSGPDAALSGAWLVFLRGVRAGSEAGILHVSPSAGLLDDLDALFSGPNLQ